MVLAVHCSTTFEVPVPEKLWITLFRPLRNVTLPEAGPGEPEAGANVTLYCVLPPAGMVNGKVRPEIEKAADPEVFAAVIVTAAPVAFRVTVCDELIVLSGTEPKFRLPGETLRPAPTPVSVIDGVFEALLMNERLPDAVPATAGEKATLKP